MTLPIGEQLRQTRQARKLSLEQAAQQTRIRLRYLEALENGDLEALPSYTQARGFLRTYAQFLKIDPEPLLSDIGAEQDQGNPPSGKEAPLAQETSATRADAILVDLGAKLKRQRELMGLSLEDVERHTHIRAHYLTALESGKLSDLPSPVQGKGMLTNYASFLGFDPEPLLLQFAEGLQADLAARRAAQARARPVKTKKPARPPMRRRPLSLDLLAGGFLIVFMVGFIIWGALRIYWAQSSKEPTPTFPSIAEILAPDTTTPSPSASPLPELNLSATDQAFTQSVSTTDQVAGEVETQPTEEPPLITPTSTLPPFDASMVQVYVVVRQRAWMRVTVDGEVEFEGRVLPGSAYLFSGNELVEILTGNGAALQIYFNQQDLGIMGQFGEVIQRAYSPSGVVLPTPIPTIPPTSTQQPTPTSTITPTASPSP